jgi:hypothetical protein
MCGWQGALTCGGACGRSGESALAAVEEATAEAAKHGKNRSEPLVAEARAMLEHSDDEQARAEKAERARAAAEEAEAAAAVAAEAEEAAAAERLRLEEEVAAL